MPAILRSAGTPIRADVSDDNFQELLWRCFDFAPIGFDRREAPTSDRLRLCNVLRTDGVDLEYLFDKMPVSKQDMPTSATFENWINFASHRTTIWGVDPGINNIFVAADGTNEDRHRYRKLSSKEYYHLCGFDKATEKRRCWKIEEGEQWKQLLDDLPSLKTANFDHLLDALRYMFNNFAAIVEPYDRQFRYRHLAFSS